MGRPLRAATGGLVYHVLNRANARLPIFDKAADFEAFERVLHEAHDRVAMRILSYCLMPNHWHFVLWPKKDGDLSDFVGWLTLTHTQRWHAHRESAGTGHLYQGRFKSFPVQADEHFLTVCRYVERNARRANLAERAERWRWSSLWRRTNGDAEAIALLSDWPVRCPRNWISWVNEPQTEREVEAIRRCINRSSPYGAERWVERTAKRLGLEITLRPRGRPKKNTKGS
jgi:REP-associated tyrosine transposase